ncbi:MAG: hypothetical protein IJP42_09990 [Selenomonadaceae bacterium]|nr:hypothetical protein [Selenomonadaceae bacterium]MBR0060472.1 hypothetical protein [Selenomonadaceae bacterium]
MIIRTPEEFYIDVDQITAVRYGYNLNYQGTQKPCVKVWLKGMDDCFVVASFDTDLEAAGYAEYLVGEWSKLTDKKVIEVS